jgi:hypothetical protein
MQLPSLICANSQASSGLRMWPQKTPGYWKAEFMNPMPVPQPPTTRSARWRWSSRPVMKPVWMYCSSGGSPPFFIPTLMTSCPRPSNAAMMSAFRSAALVSLITAIFISGSSAPVGVFFAVTR